MATAIVDQLARRLGAPGTRRGVLQRVAALATVLAAAPLAAPGVNISQAKRKRRGCRFTKKGKRWTLKGNCTIIRPLTLPPEVKLNGRNKTITVAGNIDAYDTGANVDGYRLAAAVWASDKATIRDLRLRQTSAGLTAPIPPPGYMFAHLLFSDAGGSVTNLRATGRNPATTGYLQAGVFARGASDTPLRLTRVQTRMLSFGAAIYTGPSLPAQLQGIITGFTATAVNAGLLVTTDQPVTITGSRITASQSGITVSLSSEVMLQDNVITLTAPDDSAFLPSDGISLFRPGPVTITGNTVTATRVAAERFNGIGFGTGGDGSTTGSVTGNTISGFKSVSQASCGISRNGNAGLFVDANTFPTPPGNDTNVCP